MKSARSISLRTLLLLVGLCLALAVGAGAARASVFTGSGGGNGCSSCTASGGGGGGGSAFYDCIQKAGDCGGVGIGSPAYGDLKWPSNTETYSNSNSDELALTKELVKNQCEGSHTLNSGDCPLWKAIDEEGVNTPILPDGPNTSTTATGVADAAGAPVTGWIVRVWLFKSGTTNTGVAKAPDFERVISTVPQDCSSNTTTGADNKDCINNPPSKWFYDAEYPASNTGSDFSTGASQGGALTTATSSDVSACKQHVNNAHIGAADSSVPVTGVFSKLENRPGYTDGYQSACFWNLSGGNYNPDKSWALYLAWSTNNNNLRASPGLTYAISAPPNPSAAKPNWAAIQIVAVSNREQIVPINWNSGDYEWGDKGSSTNKYGDPSSGGDNANNTGACEVSQSCATTSWSKTGSEQYFRIYQPNQGKTCNPTCPNSPCGQPCTPPNNPTISHLPFRSPQVSVSLNTPATAETNQIVPADVSMQENGDPDAPDNYATAFPTWASIDFYTPDTLYNADTKNPHSSSYPYNYIRFEGPAQTTATAPAASPGPTGGFEDQVLLRSPGIVNPPGSPNFSDTNYEMEWQQPTLQNPCMGASSVAQQEDNGNALPWSSSPTSCPVEDYNACVGKGGSNGNNQYTPGACEATVRDAWDDQIRAVGSWEQRWLASLAVETSADGTVTAPLYNTRSEWLRCSGPDAVTQPSAYCGDPGTALNQPANGQDWLDVMPDKQTVGTAQATHETTNGTFTGGTVNSGEADGYFLSAAPKTDINFNNDAKTTDTADTANCTGGVSDCDNAFIQLRVRNGSASGITSVKVLNQNNQTVYSASGDSMNTVTGQPQLSFCTEGLPVGSKLSTTSNHQQVTAGSELAGDDRCQGYDVNFHWGPSDSSQSAQYCATSDATLTPTYFKDLGANGSASFTVGSSTITPGALPAPGASGGPGQSYDKPYLQPGSNDYNTVVSNYGLYGTSDFASGKQQGYTRANVYNGVSIPPYVGTLPGHQNNSSVFSVGSCTGSYFTETDHVTQSNYAAEKATSKSTSSILWTSSSTTVETVTNWTQKYDRLNTKWSVTDRYDADGEMTSTKTSPTISKVIVVGKETWTDTTRRVTNNKTGKTTTIRTKSAKTWTPTAADGNAPYMNWQPGDGSPLTTNSCTLGRFNGTCPHTNGTYSGYYDDGYWQLHAGADQGWGINNSAARLPTTPGGIGYNVDWMLNNVPSNYQWAMAATYGSLNATWETENVTSTDVASGDVNACQPNSQNSPGVVTAYDHIHGYTSPDTGCTRNEPYMITGQNQSSQLIAVQEPRNQQ